MSFPNEMYLSIMRHEFECVLKRYVSGCHLAPVNTYATLDLPLSSTDELVWDTMCVSLRRMHLDITCFNCVEQGVLFLLCCWLADSLGWKEDKP